MKHPRIARVLDGGQTQDGSPSSKWLVSGLLSRRIATINRSIERRPNLLVPACNTPPGLGAQSVGGTKRVYRELRRRRSRKDVKPKDIKIGVDGSGTLAPKARPATLLNPRAPTLVAVPLEESKV